MSSAVSEASFPEYRELVLTEKAFASGILEATAQGEKALLREPELALFLLEKAQREQWTLAPDFRDFLRMLAPRLAELPDERAARHLTAFLLAPFPEKGVLLLDDSAFLQVLLPEISALKGVEQPPQFHPEGDVFTHTMLMLSHMAFPSALLAWSVLLHDVGKPHCFSRDPGGRIRFFNHEVVGSGMAERILARLKFPEKERAICCHAIRNHMRFGSVPEMRESKAEAMTREPGFSLELELHRLDCLSSHALMGGFLRLLDLFLRPPAAGKTVVPWITGNDLIALGAKPGPGFKEILSLFAQKQQKGLFASRQEALEALRHFLK